MALTVELVLSLEDTDVLTFVQSEFMKQIKASPAVKAYFFPDASAPAVTPPKPAFVDDVAVALVCSSLARTSLNGFARSIKKAAADAYWRANLQAGTPDLLAVSHDIYSKSSVIFS